MRRQTPWPQVRAETWLSMVPSQSSSTPLQISVAGVPGVHVWGTPLTQATTVRRQAPAPQVRGARPSSTTPLQSLSRPSQTSALAVPGTHTCA